ncbi:MAG: transaldolase, partial [Chloroflexi bacterium]|nr:transaldolase [Chloroflexota bacterium]
MDNPVFEARRLGQSIWYDNIRRGLITSGELGRLIETGVTGLTSNPTIFERAIAGSTDYDEALLGMANSGRSTAEIFEALAIEDIRAAADLLLPIYEATGGVDGYASLEVSPTLAHDTEGTVAEAERLYSVLDRPNVMIKVPATPEGIPAVRRLIAKGINVNVTLIFSLDAYREVVEAYIRGLEELTQNGGEAGGVASVASFFISRIDTAVDALIEERGRLGQDDVRHLLGKAAIANAKLAYKAFRDTFHGERFASLAGRGGRAQRPLWASTGTKNPAYSDVLYMDSLIGPDTVNTVPPATLTAFLEHGTASPTLERDLLDAQETMQALERAGIDVNKVTSRLLADGVKSFADSFTQLLA